MGFIVFYNVSRRFQYLLHMIMVRVVQRNLVCSRLFLFQLERDLVMFYKVSLKFQYSPLCLWVGVRVTVGVTRCSRGNLVCSRLFLKFLFSCIKCSRVFYNVLGGFNTYPYEYGYGLA